MPTKDERKREAAKHNSFMKGVFAKEIAASIESAHIYEDGKGRALDLPEPQHEETQAYVIWDKLASIIHHEDGHVCVVDPASFTKPGGNYLNGSFGPEEQICAESNLFPVLAGLKTSFFDENRKQVHGGLNSDRAVYIKDVLFLSNGITKNRDVLAISPVNRRFALENNRSEAECDLDLSHRVEALMRIAAVEEVDTLILHPFGCGFYDNDPKKVADLFKSWLDAHPGQFKRVLFAIGGGPNLDIFREVFPLEERNLEKVDEEEVVEEEEDVDENSTDVAQTSDGRWVFD